MSRLQGKSALITGAQHQDGTLEFIERMPSVSRTYRYDDVAQLTADFDTLMAAYRLKSWSLR